MAWIESHQELGTHRKLMRLCTLMNIDDLRAVGILHFLWWWALDNAPDGNLTGLTDKEIALACHWKGKTSLLTESLQSAGWIDKSNELAQLHDWEDYAGKLIAKRVQNRQRMRDARAELVQNTDNARAGATVPNRTVPNNRLQKSKDDGTSSKPPKIHYGEFQNVLLVPEDYAKLIGKFGQGKADELIEALSRGIASKGYRFKSHYATILSWERREKKESPGSKYTGGDPDKFHRGKYAANMISTVEDLQRLKDLRGERNESGH